jgi:hypothetical protein
MCGAWLLRHIFERLFGDQVGISAATAWEEHKDMRVVFTLLTG